MAIKLIGSKWAPGDELIKEFIVDTEADMANLPACRAGSSALVAATGKVCIVNTTGSWVEFGTGVVVATPGYTGF